jgi:hypothetical protein
VLGLHRTRNLVTKRPRTGSEQAVVGKYHVRRTHRRVARLVPHFLLPEAYRPFGRQAQSLAVAIYGHQTITESKYLQFATDRHRVVL